MTTGGDLNDDLFVQLRNLRIEHRQLDQEIIRIQTEAPYTNQLLLQRLKKKKLWLKDSIVKLESMRIPDLDA